MTSSWILSGAWRAGDKVPAPSIVTCGWDAFPISWWMGSAPLGQRLISLSGVGLCGKDSASLSCADIPMCSCPAL